MARRFTGNMNGEQFLGNINNKEVHDLNQEDTAGNGCQINEIIQAGHDKPFSQLTAAHHMAIPGYVYGGLIASLIDCHGTGTASAASYRREDRELGTPPPLAFRDGLVAGGLLAPDAPWGSPRGPRQGRGDFRSEGRGQGHGLGRGRNVRTRSGRGGPDARAYGAARTPHVFILQKEGNDLIVKYIGAIDNNAKSDQLADEKYVGMAVDALLKGNEPEPDYTRALGCTIKWKE